MNTFREILSKLPSSVRQELEVLPDSIVSSVEEIRLRSDQNVRLQCGDKVKIISHVISPAELQAILNSLIKYSYYAYEEDLAKGFVTIEGGHRVGVCGRVVMKRGQPALIKEISSLNIRFAKEIKGCSDKIINEILNEQGKPYNTLVVSPPGCGKTTLLRDIARNLSIRKIKVSICDERSEIAGMFCGRPSFDLGSGTDILDGCDKTEGIPMLIRSMSPHVIITDEIGKKADINAVEQCLSCGVSLITSIHGYSREDLFSSAISSIIKQNIFKRIIYLSSENGPGTIKEVFHV